MLEHYRDQAPGFAVVRDGDMETIAQPLDFLGINYYSPRTVLDETRSGAANAAGYCLPADEPDLVSADLRIMSAARPGFRRTEMGWEVEPTALTELLTRIRRDYPAIPVVLTENGAACNDYVAPDGRIRDPDRVRYLDGHLRAILETREAGVDVRGYFVWSLLDNFEWAYGYSKRFGLVWVDYPSGARIPKDSFRWYQETVQTRALTPVSEALARLR